MNYFIQNNDSFANIIQNETFSYVTDFHFIKIRATNFSLHSNDNVAIGQ